MVRDHTGHASAQRWLGEGAAIAVCPAVEGALVRFLVREGESVEVVKAVLADVHRWPRCQFWPGSLSYADVDLTGVHGHRQVTDSYLVALVSAHRSARLATFDRPLVARFPALCHLVASDHRARA